MNINDLESICIVGPGLMGGSIGLGLQAAGYPGRLLALAHDPSDLQMAVGAGVVHEGFRCDDELPDNIGLFCLCVPVAVMPNVMRRLAPCLNRPDVFITDVGSVKAPLVNAAANHLPHPGNFVGGHPMTSCRQRGVSFARADLFHGSTTILTPVSATRPDALDCVRSLWTALSAHVVKMSPTQHDETIARVSHLPHAIAAMLLLLAATEDGLGVAGTGLLDVTRVASRDPELWQDILTSNRDQLREALRRFVDDIHRLDAWLERREDDNIGQMLARAARVREDWVGRRFDHPDWTD